MTELNRRTAIAHEIAHGTEAWEAAKALRELGLFNSALNRIYYALFHFMSALLLTSGIEAKRHAAIPGLLGQHVLPLGWLSAADIACVSRTYAFRDLADYERTWNATRDVVDTAFAEVESLLDKARERLKEDGWTS